MAAGQAGRTQVRAYRFATRQMEWAVTHGDPLLSSDPGQLPRRWTLVSFFLAIALLAGFGVYGLIKPAPDWRDSPLILDTDSGTLYVNRAGVLYPTLNLTSALLAIDTAGLAAGRPTPKDVTADDLADAPRGALMGIPGAPSQLPTADNLVGGQWAVCDAVVLDANRVQPADQASIVSTVIAGQPAPGLALTAEQALLATITEDGAGVDYLVWNGHRSQIDPSDQVVAEALQLEGARPRVLTAGLLNAIPEAAPITVPRVVGAGDPTEAFQINTEDGRTLPIGAVFKVTRAGNPETFHVIHPDGVEEISATMTDLLRFQRSAAAGLEAVPPSALAAAPVAQRNLITEAGLPPTVPQLISVDDAPLVCAGWDGTAAGGPRWVVSTDTGMPAGSSPVVLAGTSPQAQVSQVLIAPSHGAVVQEIVAGQTPAETTKVYLISDLGVAYPVASDDALAKLGLGAAVAQAPKQVLDLLPRGPVLDPAEATKLWDSFPDAMLQGSTLATVPAAAPAAAPVGEATQTISPIIAPTT